MYPRVEYEMTEDDLQKILEASKPTPVIKVGSYIPSSPQENANRAWERLGKRMGFEYETVRPVSGKGQRFFTAVPSETLEQRDAREAQEAEERRQARVGELKGEIQARQEELADLTREGSED